MGLLQPHTPRADPWKQIERLFFSPPDILPGWEQSAPERLICFYSRATWTNQSGRGRGCFCLQGTFKEDTLEANLLLKVGRKKSKLAREEKNRSFAIIWKRNLDASWILCRKVLSCLRPTVQRDKPVEESKISGHELAWWRIPSLLSW